MDLIFCTLFNSGYLDKGLVLYDSMVERLGNFKLYVFAFDDKCYQILKKMNLEHMIVVSLKEFETTELLKVKAERTAAEYCWTCSPWIIKYVLENYKEKICTYIDADMMFFSSPQPVFDQMYEKGCSVIIVPHGFESREEEKLAEEREGKYCVEFNTFLNDENGKAALDWWAEKCLDWCYYARPGTTEWYADQKYLNVFPIKFDGVFICNDTGVGLAPWNNKLVTYAESNTTGIWIRDKRDNKIYKLVIYHFERLSFFSKHILHASSRMKDKKLHSYIYDEYVKRIIKKRNFLHKEYLLTFSYKRRVVTKNKIMALYQKYISPLRSIKHLYDLYWIKGE